MYNESQTTMCTTDFELIPVVSGVYSDAYETELGFCARSALIRLCERQKYISSANDGYYIGTHIPAIESLPFNFQRYKEKIKVIEHNKKLQEEDSRHHNQYQMEVKGMQMFVTKKLIPELELLKAEIESISIKDVVEKYEGIEYIANNFEKILQEGSKWKKEKS